MRTTIQAGVFVLAAVVLHMGVARAETISGSYDVKFEEMASNCSPPPVTMGRSKVVIDIKKSLTVNIELIPQLVGVPGNNGKIKANTTKVVPTTVIGLDGKYSIAGRIESGILQLVLVAEYINHETKKPYCTQSWNLSGVPTTDKGDKKSASTLDLLPAIASQ